MKAAISDLSWDRYCMAGNLTPTDILILCGDQWHCQCTKDTGFEGLNVYGDRRVKCVPKQCLCVLWGAFTLGCACIYSLLCREVKTSTSLWQDKDLHCLHKQISVLVSSLLISRCRWWSIDRHQLIICGVTNLRTARAPTAHTCAPYSEKQNHICIHDSAQAGLHCSSKAKVCS